MVRDYDWIGKRSILEVVMVGSVEVVKWKDGYNEGGGEEALLVII